MEKPHYINVNLPRAPQYCAITNPAPENADAIKAEINELVDLLANYNAVKNEIALSYDKVVLRHDFLMRTLTHSKQKEIMSCLC